jgi:hypothetical protein
MRISSKIKKIAYCSIMFLMLGIFIPAYWCFFVLLREKYALNWIDIFILLIALLFILFIFFLSFKDFMARNKEK